METAVQPCAYHEDRPSVATCSECGAATCEECRQEVAGHVVCAKCVESIRSRVAAQIDSEQPVTPPSDVPQPVTTFPGPPSAENPPTSMPPVREAAMATPSIPIPPPSPARIVVGIVLGLLVGWVGAIIRARIMHHTGFQWGLIDSFLGFGVGMAVVMGSGRGGIIPAVIGALIAFGAITYGWYILSGLELKGATIQIAGEGMRPLEMPPFLNIVPNIIKTWRLMDWVFVAIGVYGGFITPFRATTITREPGTT